MPAAFLAAERSPSTVVGIEACCACVGATVRPALMTITPIEVIDLTILLLRRMRPRARAVNVRGGRAGLKHGGPEPPFDARDPILYAICL